MGSRKKDRKERPKLEPQPYRPQKNTVGRKPPAWQTTTGGPWDFSIPDDTPKKPNTRKGRMPAWEQTNLGRPYTREEIDNWYGTNKQRTVGGKPPQWQTTNRGKPYTHEELANWGKPTNSVNESRSTPDTEPQAFISSEDTKKVQSDPNFFDAPAPFDREDFANQKQEEARRKRADKRAERRVEREKRIAEREKRIEERRLQREERQNFYREQRNERRRENEINSSKPETADTLAEWISAKARAENEKNTGETNIFGQGQGIDFRPGSSARGTINQEPQEDNRDFKRLYEELLNRYKSEKKQND